MKKHTIVAVTVVLYLAVATLVPHSSPIDTDDKLTELSIFSAIGDFFRNIATIVSGGDAGPDLPSPPPTPEPPANNIIEAQIPSPPAAPPTPPANLTAVNKSDEEARTEPDTDGDGLPDRIDACPNKEELTAGVGTQTITLETTASNTTNQDHVQTFSVYNEQVTLELVAVTSNTTAVIRVNGKLQEIEEQQNNLDNTIVVADIALRATDIDQFSDTAATGRVTLRASQIVYLRDGCPTEHVDDGNETTSLTNDTVAAGCTDRDKDGICDFNDGCIDADQDGLGTGTGCSGYEPPQEDR